MPAPIFTAEDYQRALWSLMPRGRAWNKEPGSVQSQFLLGLAQSLARVNDRANGLITDSFPAGTYELLPEWEESVGLPDLCAGLADTVQGRRAAMLAKLLGTGGQSVPYLIEYARTLGFDITIQEYVATRAGAMMAGYPLRGEGWGNCWAINCLSNTMIFFRAGESTAGEPLRSWNNAPLICAMNKVSPVHTILQFIYY